MSPNGPKQTSRSRGRMSAFGGKADIGFARNIEEKGGPFLLWYSERWRIRRVSSRVGTRSCREFFHTFGDNRSQLHHLLAQFCVFRDVALNTIAIGLELFA
jgi:hypothetical protein